MSELIRSQNDEKNSNKLTRRETEVLQLIASGKTDKEIAQALGITERTVRYHLQNINGRLGTATRIAAVAEAIRRKIIQ
jgi:DNA-binding NarL/FixJ family response regulator